MAGVSGFWMNAALYFNDHRIKLVTPYLYAEYPTQIKDKCLLRDSSKLRSSGLSDESYFWEAIQITDHLGLTLSNMRNKDQFMDIPEVKEIFQKYSAFAASKESNQQESTK